MLLDEISEAIQADYADPAGELPYERREGGYQGQVYSGSELIYDLDTWTKSYQLLEDVAVAFADSHWCQRDYFGLTRYEALHFGWTGFSNQVKHQTRHLFFGTPGDEQRVQSSKMLDTLGQLFLDYDLFANLPAGRVFVRVRVMPTGERPSTAAELGTAPRKRALYPNRMSPAGIPMFYAAFDETTAVMETYQPNKSNLDEPQEIVLARFQALQALQMLDLTCLPAVPSVFDHDERQNRDPLAFLHSFVRDFTRPVARDDRVHIEYVPTQVITEFVRHRLRTPGGKKLDGVIYESSRNPQSAAVVIFADPEHCGPRDNLKSFDPDPFLELVDVRYERPANYKHLWASSS